MKSNELLLDAFGRIQETVARTLDGVDGETLVRRPAGNGNSMAWLIWHLSRVEDAQLASAAGLKQVWTSQGFAGRFMLPLSERDTGYGHSSSQVDAVKARPELLLEYYDAVHRQAVESAGSLIASSTWGRAPYAKGLNALQRWQESR